MNLFQKYGSLYLAMCMTMMTYQAHASSADESSDYSSYIESFCQPDCGCTVVNGSVLTFKINPEITITFQNTTTAPFGSFSGNVQFFVTTPNGCTILGTNVPIPTTNLTNTAPAPITANGIVLVCNACCGTYQIGYNLNVTAVGNAISTTTVNFNPLPFSVTSNCGNTTQYIIPIIGDDLYNLDFSVAPVPSFSAQQLIPYAFTPDCCIAKPSCNCCGGCCK